MAGEDRCVVFSDTTFVQAIRLSVDQFGQVYVLDAGTSQIIKLSPKGKVMARSGGYGWSEQSFDQPSDLAATNGLEAFVSDYGNHRIQRFDRNLSLLSSLPLVSDETGSRSFGYPRSVSVATSGALYITDGENNRIVKVDIDGNQRFFGGIDAAQGELHYPTKVRVSSNELVFVQDSNVIVTFDRFGNYVRRIADHQFNRLTTFTIDGDTIYVLDSCSVFKINERGIIEDTLKDICSLYTGAKLQPIDIAVYQRKCYILTEHRIWLINLYELFRKKE